MSRHRRRPSSIRPVAKHDSTAPAYVHEKSTPRDASVALSESHAGPRPMDDEVTQVRANTNHPSTTAPHPSLQAPLSRRQERGSHKAMSLPSCFRGIVQDHAEANVVNGAFAFARHRFDQHLDRNWDIFERTVRITMSRYWRRYYHDRSEPLADVYLVVHDRWVPKLMLQPMFVLPEFGSGLVTSYQRATIDVIRREQRAWVASNKAYWSAADRKRILQESLSLETQLAMRQELTMAASRLSESDRRLFLRAFILGDSYDDIANDLDIRVAALRQRLYELRKRLLENAPALAARFRLISNNTSGKKS